MKRIGFIKKFYISLSALSCCHAAVSTTIENMRFARPEDAEGILRIYAPVVRDTAISFETEAPTIQEIKKRIQEIQLNYPWIVFEKNGEICGYAYASEHRKRVAYQWTVESSVYVREDQRKQGLATKLYEKLFSLLKQQNFVNVYAGITLPNEASVRFHESLGFNYFCTYESVGFKLGKWHDVGWWSLQLNERVSPPKLPLKIDELVLP